MRARGRLSRWSGDDLGYNGAMVSYGKGVLVGAILGAVTFFACLVGYLVWDGLQVADLVKSLTAAIVFIVVWLVLLLRLARRRG